ncbi:hypothetical protein BGZ96_010446 [Linnemannia gamsii]|uniref:Extracellular membrane protein CFEM domain-containing protein n=1 Tax=Linnemannia gamsii TaxID=64522 RepID=A0ABQ7JUN5_9FUNG|nr:hypothetical protein BGZ96_010446 [Linnemannia gamsii]
MHFTSTVASALAIILAVTSVTVSAQEQPGDGFGVSCTACLLTTAIAISPACNADSLALKNAPDAMTPEERACLCPLASDPSSAWIQACITPDACVAEVITPYAQMFVSMKDAICADGGVTPPPPATTTPPAPGTTSATTSTAAPATSSTKPSNATSAAPTPTKPPGKSGAAGSLFGSSNKVVAGAALTIASVAALLL